jgi:ABC-type glycerol-3-phosphate transport system permease component
MQQPFGEEMQHPYAIPGDANAWPHTDAKDELARSQVRLMWRKARTYLLVIAIAIYSFLPIYWMFVSSIRPPQELFGQPSLVPKSFTLEYFNVLFELTNFPVNFMNSLIVTVLTTIITLFCAIPMAYVLTRFQIKGKSILTNIMLGAYMFPPMLLAIPLYAIFVKIHLDNTLLSLVLAHTTITLPLGVWLLGGFFKTLPFEIEQSAMIDGCTRFQAFRLVVLPLSLPGLVTVSIFSFLLSWTDYTYALMLIASDANKTIPIGLASMLGSYDIRWGEIMAGSTIITLPLLVIFVFLSRYFIKGLAAGAMKG